MTNTLSLALRNLMRNRRRSIATLMALAIGAAAVLLFGGYSTDIRFALLTGYVRDGGHLQIQHKDYFRYGNGNPTAYGISDYEKIIAAIRADEVLKPLIAVVSPTLQFGGIAGNYEAGVSRTVLAVGYSAPDKALMRQWDQFHTGQEPTPYALSGMSMDAAVVGIGVARVLLLCQTLGVADCPAPTGDPKPTGKALPADIAALANLPEASSPSHRPGASPGGKARIELLASHGRGSPNVAALSVIAAEDQGFKELDDVAVILQLQQAQKLVYGRGAPRATAIMVQLEKTEKIPAAKQRLIKLLSEVASNKSLDVLDFETLNPFYTQTQQLFDTIFAFIFVLIGGIVLFTVGNTMNAAVVERTIEIGTLRAIGLRQMGVRRLFVVEGFILGCVGAALGVTVAICLAALVNLLDLTWLPPGSSSRLPLSIRIWGELGIIVTTALGMVVVATASAWWPAWRAAKLKIVDALRHA